VGQGVNLHALAYFGSRYPCFLKALNHLVSIIYHFKPVSYIRHRSSDTGLILSSVFCLPSFNPKHPTSHSQTSNLLPFLLLAFLLPLKVAYPQDKGADNIKTAPIYLYGQINALTLADTLEIYVYPQFLGKGTHLPEPQYERIPIIQGDGVFGLPSSGVFQFTTDPIPDFAYILMVGKTSGTLMDYYLALPGDTVGVVLDRITNKRSFVGPDAESYILQQQLKDLRMGRIFDLPAFITVADKPKFLAQLTRHDTIPYGIKSLLPITGREEEQDSFRERIPQTENENGLSLSLIQLYRGKLPDHLLDALQADLWAWDQVPAVEAFNLALREPLQEWAQTYKDLIKNQNPGPVSTSAALMATAYTDYLLETAIAKARMEKLKTWDIIHETQDPILRDRLAAKFIIKYFPRIADREAYMDQAIASATDSLSLALLTQYRSNLSIGKMVSEAPLTDRGGNEVCLTSLKGKVVFIDFWFTGCGACLTYYSNVLKPLKDSLAGRDDIQFISISTDKKTAQWEKSIDGGKYTDPLAINLHTSGMAIQHPFLKAYNIHSFPSQLLLDKEGRIVRISEMGTYPEALDIIMKTIHL
jgi:thiol-disulfide isomerase/thioredoxin